VIDPRVLFVLVWVGVDGGLAYGVAKNAEWGDTLRLSMPALPKAQTRPIEQTILPGFSLPKLDSRYKQTLARPLFVPTRRPAPPPPPPPPPPKPTMVKGQFRLSGVMIQPNAGYAILVEKESGRTRRVQTGQTINGITLASVKPDRVVLTQYDEIEELILKVQPSSKSTPTQSAAAAARGGPAARIPARVPVDQSRAQAAVAQQMANIKNLIDQKAKTTK
jgi:hypothetical protein